MKALATFQTCYFDTPIDKRMGLLPIANSRDIELSFLWYYMWHSSTHGILANFDEKYGWRNRNTIKKTYNTSSWMQSFIIKLKTLIFSCNPFYICIRNLMEVVYKWHNQNIFVFLLIGL